ncbi:hypothetical protein LJC09_01805 [Desulfovibrio sp. OttesenSCG-928-F20]|nr:hypothetical protein [Desulfovibrio sp. OttesenSCG-928-F20]
MSSITMRIAMRRTLPLFLALLLVAGLAACGGKQFGDGDIRTISGVSTGTVLDVSDVIVEEDPSLVGPGIGLAAGGLLGSQFGAGTGRLLFTLGGAVLGADIGGYGDMDYYKRRYRAKQLTMEMDSGGILMVVLGDYEYFVRGDRVRVIATDEGRATVQHI